MPTASQHSEGDRKWRKRRIFLRAGQAVMVVGAGVLIVHWLTHLEVFGKSQPPFLVDLAVGYPMGFLLLVVGAIIASRKPS